jgi:hypothetical protein
VLDAGVDVRRGARLAHAVRAALQVCGLTPGGGVPGWRFGEPAPGAVLGAVPPPWCLAGKVTPCWVKHCR